MQKFIGIFLILFLLTSCSKKRNEKFVAYAELNDETLLHFDAVFRKSDDGLFTMFLSKDSELGPEHRLNFFNFEKEKMKTKLVAADSARHHNLPYANFSTLFYQRDVSLDHHHTFNYKDMDSWIEIDNIGFRKIEGRFQIAMKTVAHNEDDNPYFPYLTDTLFFRVGRFIAKRIN